VLAELSALLGGDIVVAPDAQNVVRHTRDYCVEGNPGVGILALTYPRNTGQVSAILRYCNQQRIAVQPQGGMTGLSGGGVPTGPCVVVSLERMRAIKEIDTAAGTITVEAGVVMQAVQQAAEDADLFFPLDLGGRGSCQIGGNLSTNAGGNRVLRFGMARDLVLGVEAVLADGTVIDALRKVIKNNSGYDVRQLFIGRHPRHHHGRGAAPVSQTAQRLHGDLCGGRLRGGTGVAVTCTHRVCLAADSL